MKLQETVYLLGTLVSLRNTVQGDCGCSQSRAKRLSSPDDALEFPEEQRQTSFADAARKYRNMVFIKGGIFTIGTNTPMIQSDGEHPARRKNLDDFYLDETEVSNEQFAKFVEQTSYVTEAERLGDSFVLSSFVKDERSAKGAVQAVPWWWSVNNATWQQPEGPGSDLTNRSHHPVVHVSWTDAKRYCEHFDKRLPTEAEWEVACKLSLGGYKYPWDDSVVTADAQRSANIWQGEFPNQNLKSDGYESTAPVNAYGPLPGLPLRNMIGNVWEWTSDVWNTNHKASPPSNTPNRVKKGGSYMCHESYCFRYRCEARSENTLDTSAGNLGFRCAANVG